MNANELRIGNHIDSPYGILPIFGISKDCIEVEYNFDGAPIYLDECNPIPITEEWLLSFGWCWNDETKSFEKKGLPNGHIKQTEFGWNMFNYVLNSMTTNKGFYFVHQLQNLYFALTGEELTLKTEL